MIEIEERWFKYPPYKPGCDLNPLKAPEPEICDKPENVAVCLSWPLTDKCHMESRKCPISKKRHKRK